MDDEQFKQVMLMIQGVKYDVQAVTTNLKESINQLNSKIDTFKVDFMTRIESITSKDESCFKSLDYRVPKLDKVIEGK